MENRRAEQSTFLKPHQSDFLISWAQYVAADGDIQEPTRNFGDGQSQQTEHSAFFVNAGSRRINESAKTESLTWHTFLLRKANKKVCAQ